jgi:hypothetical protein
MGGVARADAPETPCLGQGRKAVPGPRQRIEARAHTIHMFPAPLYEPPIRFLSPPPWCSYNQRDPLRFVPGRQIAAAVLFPDGFKALVN